MLSVKEWNSRDDEKPFWDFYKGRPSVDDKSICCLALDVDVLTGSSYLDAPNISNYGHTHPDGLDYILISEDPSYEYNNFICGDVYDPECAAGFQEKEMLFFEKIAAQLGVSDNLPTFPNPLLVSGFLGTSSFFYKPKFDAAIYNIAIRDDWWASTSPEITHEMLLLANRIHREVFRTQHFLLSRKVYENKIKNGGTLKYLEGTNRIKFTDFADWAESIALELPEKFPRNRKSQVKAKKHLIWQERVDELYSKNNRLSHFAICMRLAPELGTSGANLRRRTDNPKNK